MYAVMSAGQHEDNEDKDVMGYELPRRIRGEKESVRVSPANRDTTPPQVERPRSKVQGEMRWISSPLWLSTRSTALAR
jgi:hypothetical protein